jgi:hypothetical protein
MPRPSTGTLVRIASVIVVCIFGAALFFLGSENGVAGRGLAEVFAAATSGSEHLPNRVNRTPRYNAGAASSPWTLLPRTFVQDPLLLLDGYQAYDKTQRRGVGGLETPEFTLPTLVPAEAFTDMEIKQRIWQSSRFCTFVPLELISEAHRDLARHAMLSWGDHRTFYVVFSQELRKHAEWTHAALTAAYEMDPEVALDAQRWIDTAVSLAGKEINGVRVANVTQSIIPPNVLMVPPSHFHPPPQPASADGRTRRFDGNDRTSFGRRVRELMREAAVVQASDNYPRQDKKKGKRATWRLRSPRDAVLVLNGESRELQDLTNHMRRMNAGHERATQWPSSEGKSLMMWDYITRTMEWQGLADGSPMIDPELNWGTGFTECEWVMKADTDTFINRASLRQDELLGIHNLNWDGTLKLLDPRRDPAYLGLAMGFNAEDVFLFGGTGYYFTRAALDKVADHPLVSFRSCPLLTVFLHKPHVLTVEDAIIGNCIKVFSEKLQIQISHHHVANGRLSIGQPVHLYEAFSKHRSRCWCCYRSLHKANTGTHLVAMEVMRNHCHMAWAPATGDRVAGLPLLIPESQGFSSREEHGEYCGALALSNDDVCPVMARGHTDQVVDIRAEFERKGGAARGEAPLPAPKHG